MFKAKWMMANGFSILVVALLAAATYLDNNDRKPGVAAPHTVAINTPPAGQTTAEKVIGDRATMESLMEHDRNDPVRVEFQQAFEQALDDFRKQQEKVAEVCKKNTDPAFCRNAQVRSEVAWTSLWHQVSALNRHERDYNEKYISALPKTLEELDKSWN